jgi:hypothetical protein
MIICGSIDKDSGSKRSDGEYRMYEDVTSSAKRATPASAHFAEALVNITHSCQFHLYDMDLRAAVDVLVLKWAESTDANDYFSDHPNPQVLSLHRLVRSQADQFPPDVRPAVGSAYTERICVSNAASLKCRQ